MKGPDVAGVRLAARKARARKSESLEFGTRSDVAAIVVPSLTYAALAAAGITNSNIGVSTLRDDPGVDDGDQLGQSQAIRSDEYATESPLWLGESARAGDDAVTPLSVSNDFFAQLPDGPISSLVFFDGSLLSLSTVIPETALFALKWWLPTLLLFVGMPLWFRLVAGQKRWGYLAAFLTFLAPASMWWSGRPVNSIGFAVAGCALALIGARMLADPSRFGRFCAVLSIGVAGLLLARTPTYYQPLAIVVALPIVAATAGFLLANAEPLRKRLLAVGLIGLSGAVWTIGIFLENWDAVSSGLGTTYPGDRTSSGAYVEPGRVFGATNFFTIRETGTAPETNVTELASAFTVLILSAVVLLVGQKLTAAREQKAALLIVSVAALFWLSWATVNWGSIGAAIPIANIVPEVRAASAVGFLAIIAFALIMALARQQFSFRVSFAAAGFAALGSAYGGSALQQDAVPFLSTATIWISAGVTFAAVFALVRYGGSVWSFAFAVLCSATLVATSTPVLFGLGDLRGNDTAETFLLRGESARASGEVWASDSAAVDSLFTATGVPSLSTRQQIGPDAKAWRMLDPTGAHESLWNRGGLHIRFAWESESNGLDFELPVADTIVITSSPCEVQLRFPSLRYVVSSDRIDSPCVTNIGNFQWSGVDHTIYEVTPAG